MARQVHRQVGKYLVQPTQLNIDLNLISKNSINMPCGKILLHHVSQFKPSKHKKLNILNYFKIVIKYFQLLEVGTHGNTQFVPIVHQKSCILVASNNTYRTNQRMKAYFVDFFFHAKFVVVYKQCQRDLSNATIKTFVGNVACN